MHFYYLAAHGKAKENQGGIFLMPEVTPDERGRRAYQIQKEKAVESAVEKIRLNLGQDWRLFSLDDIELLNYVLGEVWVSMDRKTWGQCAFTRLARSDIERILEIGKDIKKTEQREKGDIMEVIAMVKKGL